MKSRVRNTEGTTGNINSKPLIYKLKNPKIFRVTGFLILAVLIMGSIQKTDAQSARSARKLPSQILRKMNKKPQQTSPKLRGTRGGQPGTGDRLIQDILNVSLVGRWADGPCWTETVKGNYAYIGNGGYFSILDISNPTSIELVSRITLPPNVVKSIGFSGSYRAYVGPAPSTVADIAISGGYAYVANGSNGLRIIDVSDPTNPKVVGDFYRKVDGAPAGNYVGVSVSGDYAYLTDSDYGLFSDAGLLVIDVSDPTNPKEVGSYSSSDFNTIDAVSVSGGYAYVAGDNYGTGGLRIIDVSDPESPQEVGSFDIGDYVGVSDVSVSGGYAYLTDTTDTLDTETGGLLVIDVSDPKNPKQVSSFPTAGYANGVSVSGGFAYVAVNGLGLRVIDVSDPKSPHVTSTFITTHDVNSVSVDGGYAYLADGSDGLQAVDVSDPKNPQKVGFYGTGDEAYSVSVSGEYAYVADGKAGLRVIDVSDPKSPQQVGFFDTKGSAVSVAVNGEYAYLTVATDLHDTEAGGLRVIDVSDPTNPKEVGSYSSYDSGDYAASVSLSEGYAYLANGDSLLVIDVSDPKNPKQVSSFPTAGYANGVSVSGGYAYLAAGKSGLLVIDVSDPKSPQEVGFYDNSTMGTDATDVSVSEGYAYLAAGFESGLLVIDISDPKNPREVGRALGSASIVSPGAGSVSVSGGYAYVDGLKVIDVSNPSRPGAVGDYDIGASDVFAYGGYAYVAGGDGGMYILKNDLLSTPIEKTPDIPHTFAVSQNYPNPFNPSTNIHYTLPGSQHVRLRVYNILGQLVATLVNKDQPAGSYTVRFDAHDLPSGMYIYRLKAGNSTETKKMMLVK